MKTIDWIERMIA